MKAPLLLFVGALALATPAHATPADTLRLTLDEAVARALAFGDEARIARAGVGVADGQVREAFAAALPQVTGSVTYNRKFDSIFRNLGGGGDTTGIADLFAATPATYISKAMTRQPRPVNVETSGSKKRGSILWIA